MWMQTRLHRREMREMLQFLLALLLLRLLQTMLKATVLVPATVPVRALALLRQYIGLASRHRFFKSFAA